MVEKPTRLFNRHVLGKGFTLVELLVVIGIVAVLASILLPALSKARDHAKDVVCQVQLRSIGQTLQLYTEAFDGQFSPFWFFDDGGGVLWFTQPERVMWQYTAQDYYQDPKILLCPKNSAPNISGPAGGFSDDDLDPWGPVQWMPKLPALGDRYAEYGVTRAGKPVSGYTVNDWLGVAGVSDPENNHWETIQSANSENIPMVLDGGWYSGQPSDNARPSATATDKVQHGAFDSMDRFVFSRHRDGGQAVFMDMSVRRVSVKGLWRLKWHRNFDISNAFARPSYIWPDWVEDLLE